MACSDKARAALAEDLLAVLARHTKILCSDCASGALVQLAAMAMADTRPEEVDVIRRQAEDRCALLMESVELRLEQRRTAPPSDVRH